MEVKFLGKETDDDGSIEYKYKGAMNDERGTIDDKARVFDVTYTVEDGKVVENVDNEDYMADSEDRLYSKIEDMVVLSGAIEEGNSGEQKVEIDGVETTLKTTITKVMVDSFTTVSEAEAEGIRTESIRKKEPIQRDRGLLHSAIRPMAPIKMILLFSDTDFQ